MYLSILKYICILANVYSSLLITCVDWWMFLIWSSCRFPDQNNTFRGHCLSMKRQFSLRGLIIIYEWTKFSKNNDFGIFITDCKNVRKEEKKEVDMNFCKFLNSQKWVPKSITALSEHLNFFHLRVHFLFVKQIKCPVSDNFFVIST